MQLDILLIHAGLIHTYTVWLRLNEESLCDLLCWCKYKPANTAVAQTACLRPGCSSVDRWKQPRLGLNQFFKLNFFCTVIITHCVCSYRHWVVVKASNTSPMLQDGKKKKKVPSEAFDGPKFACNCTKQITTNTSAAAWSSMIVSLLCAFTPRSLFCPIIE